MTKKLLEFVWVFLLLFLKISGELKIMNKDLVKQNYKIGIIWPGCIKTYLRQLHFQKHIL